MYHQNVSLDPKIVIFCLWVSRDISWTPRVHVGRWFRWLMVPLQTMVYSVALKEDRWYMVKFKWEMSMMHSNFIIENLLIPLSQWRNNLLGGFHTNHCAPVCALLTAFRAASIDMVVDPFLLQSEVINYIQSYSNLLTKYMKMKSEDEVYGNSDFMN